ncbi:MAG: O-antigen ligase family protein [Chloroflexota bacterium]
MERLFPQNEDFAENLVRSIVQLPKALWMVLGVLGLAGLGAGIIVQPELVVFALVGIGIGIPAALFAWNRPEFILVAVVFLSSGFISANKMEVGGGLELRDVALIGSLGLLVFQGIIRKELKIIWWPVAAPLIVFLLIAIVSLFNALMFENVALNWAFNDMRILIYYAMFFSTGWAIKNEKQLMIVWLGLFLIADLIAVIIFIQQPLGASNPLLESMVGGRWDLIDQGVAVRVVPAAHALMHFMAVIAFVFIVYAQHIKWLFWFGIFQFGFLNVSLLLTFTRSQWLATAIALFLIGIYIFPQYKALIFRWAVKYSVPTILILIFLFGVFGTTISKALEEIPIVGGVVDRFATIFTPSETLETNSLEWREFEFQQGFAALRESPWLGVSLGNSYRQVTTLQGEVLGWWTDGNLERGYISRFTRFIHSSYLAIAVKMGIPGFIAFMWFCLAFIWESWRLARRMPDSLNKGFVLAIFTAFIGLMQWSVFHTHFMRTESTIAVGIMTGIVASINHLHEKSSRTQGSNSNGNNDTQAHRNVLGEQPLSS